MGAVQVAAPSAVRTKTLTLTGTQLRTLHTNAVQLLSPPGANKWLKIHDISMLASAGLTSHTLVSPTFSYAEFQTLLPKFGGGFLSTAAVSPGGVANTDAAYDIGTGDFTADFFMSRPIGVNRMIPLSLDNNIDLSWFLYFAEGEFNDHLCYIGNVGGGPNFETTFTPTPGTWHHIAVTRTAGDISVYVDGILVCVPTTDSRDYTGAASIRLGGCISSGFPNDGTAVYIDEFRFVNGVALGGGGVFPVPTSPYVYTTQDVLLHFDVPGTTITNEAGPAFTAETGTAQLASKTSLAPGVQYSDNLCSYPTTLFTGVLNSGSPTSAVGAVAGPYFHTYDHTLAVFVNKGLYLIDIADSVTAGDGTLQVTIRYEVAKVPT